MSWHLSDVLSRMVPALLCRYIHWVLYGSCVLCHYSQGYMRMSLRWQEQASSFCRKAVGTIRELCPLLQGLYGQPFSFPLHFRHLIATHCLCWVIKWQLGMNRFCWSTSCSALAYLILYYSNDADRWRNQTQQTLQLIMGGSRVGRKYEQRSFLAFGRGNKANSERKCMHSF